MNKIVTLSAVAAFLFSPAFAQDESGQSSQSDAPASQAALPAACEAAANEGHAGHGMDMGQMMSGMGDMMGQMSEAQKANMQAMMKMHDPMMRAMMIQDPDLAFNCGMIAHHMGAIAMAEVELKMGEDEKSKTLAQEIIDAQKQEIAEMTAWVEEHAGRQ